MVSDRNIEILAPLLKKKKKDKFWQSVSNCTYLFQHCLYSVSMYSCISVF